MDFCRFLEGGKSCSRSFEQHPLFFKSIFMASSRSDLLDEIRVAEKDRKLVIYDISEAEFALDISERKRVELEREKLQAQFATGTEDG